MKKRTAVIYFSILSLVIVSLSIGGWVWIDNDKERVLIEDEQRAASSTAELALKEAVSSEAEKKVYSTPPIEPLKQSEQDVSSSTASGIEANPEPIKAEPIIGENTGSASKTEPEPPPPPSSSEESKPTSSSKTETKSENSSSSKATSSSSAASKTEKSSSSANSKASSTPKDGDRKTVDGVEYAYDSVFGWSKVTGGKGEAAPDMVPNGNKVGQMG